MATVKFSSTSLFYTDLKERVNKYFEEKKRSTYGGTRAYIKAILLLAAFVVIYSILVFATPGNLIAIGLCMLLGFSTATIGFNVMHDGSHGTFSESKTVNRLAALTLNFLGGSEYFWNIKHNMVHHTYTNVDGHDDDIEIAPLMRMCETQQKRKMHKYQYIYWFLLYGFMYFTWVFYLDMKKYFSRRIGAKSGIKIDIKTHVGFWFSKALYIFSFILLPIYMVGLADFLLGYFIFIFTTGLVISVVFQLAHTVEHVEFPQANDQSVIETDWAVHQVLTTSNFATRSRIVSFFTGGLNHQIEHHLFPRISHIFYPDISKIVRKTCADYGLVYLEQRTVLNAITSHVRFLRAMGK